MVRRIAVPSHGSNFMHRLQIAHHQGRSQHCSTLTRVELHASLTPASFAASVCLLQYPHTGRTSCIVARSARRQVANRIAVPSHGSNFMHPHRYPRRRVAATNCSTLTRVELHASSSIESMVRRCVNCSTLTRVELHASACVDSAASLSADCSTLTRVELHASSSRPWVARLTGNCSTLTRVELHASNG